jgi:hypothetical protein
MAAEHILHMQKALSQMNLQIHHVLSDITGTSGQAILDAILSGKRDPSNRRNSVIVGEEPAGQGGAGSRWRLPAGASVHPEGIAGGIPLLPEADLGVGSGDGTFDAGSSQRDRGSDATTHQGYGPSPA